MPSVIAIFGGDYATLLFTLGVMQRDYAVEFTSVSKHKVRAI